MSEPSALNRAMWDERVPIHVSSEFYDVEGFLAGRNALRPFEPQEMGSVQDQTLLHLQCHFGLDTLSWARLGAKVTGLDFSEAAVQAARELARRSGLASDFVAADLYDAEQALAGRRFDVVYTGLGALNWLPDIDAWARVVKRLLKPQGRLYLVEFHPFTNVFADEELVLEESYFNRGPFHWCEPGTYADFSAPTVHNHSVEWHHGMGDVLSAIAATGLRLQFLHEHDFTLFARWSLLRRGDQGHYRLPPGLPSLPLMYSLLAGAP